MSRAEAVRLADGRMAETTGQLLLDFRRESAPRAAQVYALAPVAMDTWFGRGVQAEDRGDLEGAAAAYLRAAESGDEEPEVYFNLGNVLYDLGREADAAERYLHAVERDREFAEAWNNLGNSLAILGRHEEAIRAYRTALAVEPAYADAHCNLADALEQLGRPAEAYLHRQACVQAYPSERRLRIYRANMGSFDEED